MVGKGNGTITVKLSRIGIFVALVLILGLSAWLRISLPYNSVMGKEIRFTTVDAYAHVRMADYQYEHFPETMKTDNYLNYPYTNPSPARPLWSWIIASLAKTLGTSVDLIAAWLPAILGVLIVLWVFLMGWLMFGKWAGLIGALFVAVIPGELIGRTGLGCADHDALEITLLLLVVMFIIIAMKRKWYWGIGSGIMLGLYNLNWAGSPLLTLMLCIYLLVQTIIDKYRNKQDYNLYMTFFITLLLGFTIYCVAVPFRNLERYYVLFYGAATMFSSIIALLTWLFRNKKPKHYLILWCGLIVSGLIILIVVVPSFGYDVYQALTPFFPQLSGFGSTISEMMPLFYYRGNIEFTTVWSYFGLCFWSGLAGMIYFLYKYWREPYCLMFGMWSILTMILVVIQRRYGIYAALSMSVYTGYVCWEIGKKVTIRYLTKHDKKRGKSPYNIGYGVMTGLIMILFLFVPVFMGATRTALQMPYIPPTSWMDACKWLKNNTPSVNHDKPEYSVLSWWDYGYWITREGKRPVVLSPGGGSTVPMARYLLSKNNESIMVHSSGQIDEKPYSVDEVRKLFGVKYIVIDYQMVTGKFYAIPEAAMYTPNNIEDTMIMKLWTTGKHCNWNKVWESTQTYMKDKQVKIYEYTEK